MRRGADRRRDDEDTGRSEPRKPRPADDTLDDDELLDRYGRAAFAREIVERRRR